jgi:hypothetical protein
MACSKWTPEDIEFLIKNNSKYTSTQLAALMGRNQRAIETKRIRLKLKANEKVTNEAKRVAKLKEKILIGRVTKFVKIEDVNVLEVGLK